MAKKTIWSKLKKAFKKQTSSNLKKDSGTSTKKTSSSKSSSQSTTRNAYKSTIEAKQNKIQEAFKADQSVKLKQSAQTASQRTAQRQTQKSNAVKNDVKLAMQKSNVESNKKKQTNAVNNDLKTKRNQQNLQAKAKEKERKKKVQAEWNKASEQIAKEQGFSSAGQARKQGSAQMTANDIKYGQKKNDALYSATKGVASGASAGVTDLTKYVAAPEIREALETAEKNQTDAGKAAEALGFLAGSLPSIAATAGASALVGKSAIKGTGKLVGRDLSEEAVVSKLAPLLENKAAKLSAKGGVKITGEDLAKSIFKEYAEDIGMNIGGWGQVQALTEAADAKANGESATKAYAKAQAANVLTGIPVNNFVAGREAINGVKGAINKARVASKADDILNPDYNLYLKNEGNVGYHAGDLGKPMPKQKGTKVIEETMAENGIEVREGERPTLDDVLNAKDKWKNVSKPNEDGIKVSKVAYTNIYQVSTKEQAEKIADNITLSGDYTFAKSSNKEEIKSATERVIKDIDGAISKIKSIANDTYKTHFWQMEKDAYDVYSLTAITQNELKNADLTKEARQELDDVLSDCFLAQAKISTPNGKVMQARQAFASSDPYVKAKVATENVVDLLSKSLDFTKKLKDAGITFETTKEKKETIAKLIREGGKELGEDLTDISDAILDLINVTAKDEVEEAYAKVMSKANEHFKPSFMQYLQEWRYLAMLSAPKTHGANAIGNIVFGSIRQLSNALGYGIENGLIKSNLVDSSYLHTKGNLSAEALSEAVTKEPKTEFGKKALEFYNKWAKEHYKIDPKLEAQLLNSNPNRKFKGAGKLAQANSNMLEAVDKVALQINYRESFIKLCKANEGKLTDEAYEKIAAMAKDEAMVATFKDYNAIANSLSKFANNISNANKNIAQRGIGVVANALIPFAKSTSNITKQSINYSPVGLIRGFYNINKALKSGNQTQIGKAVEQLAAGATGSTIGIIGFLFASKSDLFNGNAGEDAGAKYKRNLGVQDYSINVGDYTYSLDWLSPNVSMFFAGIETYKALKDLELGNFYENSEKLSNILDTIVQPILEMSMMSGVDNMIDSITNNYTDSSEPWWARAGYNLAESYAGSMIPTVVSQIAKGLYDSDMQITGDTELESVINSLKYRAGLANVGKNPLGAATDPYGNIKNERTTAGDKAKAAAKNVLLPGRIQKVTADKMDDKMVDLYHKAIEAGVDESTAAQIFPKQSYNREMTVGKKESGKVKLTMTNKALSAYNQGKTLAGKDVAKQAMKQEAFDGWSKAQKNEFINNAKTDLKGTMKQIWNTSEFKSLSDEDKVTFIKSLLTSSGDKAQGSKRSEELAGWKAMGRSETNYVFKNDLTATQQNNYKPISSIVSKKEYIKAAEACLSDNGTYTIASLTAGLDSMDLTTEQKSAIFDALKNANTKATYGSSSSGSSGSGSGSGSSSKSSTADIDTSAYKTKKFTPKSSSSSTTSKGYTLKVKSNVSNKATPPELEEFKFKI